MNTMISVNGVPRTKLSVFIHKGIELIPRNSARGYYDIEWGSPPRIKGASALGAAYYAYASLEGLELESLATHPISATNRVGWWVMSHYSFTLQDLMNINSFADSVMFRESVADALERQGL